MRIVKVETITDTFKEPTTYNENQKVFCRTVKITLENGTEKILTLRELRLRDLKRTINELTTQHYDYDLDRKMLMFKPFL
ncbi:MAG: hypothetical protein ACE5K4_12500 [Candidatus Hydrothermarchaeota archaeon]